MCNVGGAANETFLLFAFCFLPYDTLAKHTKHKVGLR